MECRRALSQYYRGDQLRALIGSSMPEGKFPLQRWKMVQHEGREERREERREAREGREEVELQTTIPCEGDTTVWEEEVN